MQLFTVHTHAHTITNYAIKQQIHINCMSRQSSLTRIVNPEVIVHPGDEYGAQFHCR